ncbi:MAG: McrC family protein [Acidobacteriota bacterium]
MINAFEFQKVKTSKLPSIWREDGALDELEKFLQSNWEKRSIFYSDKKISSRQQFIDFDRRDGFKTQNYIGTITYRGEQLNIFPKIFKADEDDYDASELDIHDLIDDLIMWLGYCDKFNFPFVSMKGEMDNTETFLELLITVYVHYVKAAVDRQLFFRYEEVEDNGCTPKGKIDFKDYAIRKYPAGQWDKLQYTYSTFMFDNLLNRIIKCTCRTLEGITTQVNNRRIIHDILMKLGDVEDVNCMPYDCDAIHLNALQANYTIILSMSKMFLLNKVSSQNMGVSETFCFLFPAELLFEGFVGGFMREAFNDRVKLSTQTRDLFLTELVVDGEVVGNRFQLKEDIVVQTDDTIIILDTKYKEIDHLDRIKKDSERLGITDADMKQMAVYANRRGAKRMYLLYPLYRNTMPDETEVVFNIIDGRSDVAVKIPLQILQVPFSFGDDSEKTKKLLLDILGKTIQ